MKNKFDNTALTVDIFKNKIDENEEGCCLQFVVVMIILSIFVLVFF